MVRLAVGSAALASLLVVPLTSPVPAAAAVRPGLNTAGNPTANVSAASVVKACWSAPTSSSCQIAAVRAINAGRAREHLRSLVLPARWSSYSATSRLLYLFNSERAARGETTLRTSQPTLNVYATRAAAAEADPAIVPSVRIAGRAWTGWASNWALAENPIVAVFMWVYDDGLNSPNMDCTTSHQAGCWGHRHDVLAWGTSRTLTIGLGVARVAQKSWQGHLTSYTTLLVSTP